MLEMGERKEERFGDGNFFSWRFGQGWVCGCRKGRGRARRGVNWCSGMGGIE